jgi:hypothetical protein
VTADQAKRKALALFRRSAMKPIPKKPRIIIAQVEVYSLTWSSDLHRGIWLSEHRSAERQASSRGTLPEN